MVNTINAV
jgi:hypothetical protein